jgi:glycosyltransferase involved in cell wall biosynthesis
MSNKPRIVQHVAGFDQIGGPASQLRRLLRSRMADKFHFEVVSQDRPARGINIRLMLQMSSAMKRVRPDIVHVRGLQNEGFHGVMAAYLAGCRNVLVSVEGFAEDTNVRSPIKRWVLSRLLEPFTLLLARRVYCVCSSATQRMIIQRYAHNKCSVIYNGIDISPLLTNNHTLRKQLGAGNNETVVLYAGRISRDKGLLVLANALRSLQDSFLVWVAGEGPDTECVRAAFGPLIERGKVKMLGRRDDVAALLNACDIFVLPSVYENFSIALLEAMHAGRPVLTTAVGGNPELVVDGITGVLIPVGDCSALAHNLSVLFKDPELCSEMGRNGRKRIEKYFSLDQTIERLTDLYNSMLIQ